MSILDSLPHTVSTKRRTRTRDDLGGSIDSFATTTGVSTWQQSASSAERDAYAKRSQDKVARFYFTSAPGLDERDVIVGTDGLEYEVRHSSGPDASSGLGVVWKVIGVHESGTA